MLIDRLRRKSRDGSWIPEIDGLRFLAISSVFLFHLAGEVAHRGGEELTVAPGLAWVGRLLGNGDRGVGIFFVISGMLLALPFARHALQGTRQVSLRSYYVRRLTRLEVPYIVSTLMALAMIVIYLRGMPAGFWRHVVATLFYQHGLIYGTPSPVNSVAWSLEVEVQFYMLAPLIMQWFRLGPKLLRRGTMLAAIPAIALAQQPWAQNERFSLTLLFYLQYFVAGLLVADIFVLDLARLKTSWLWDGLGLGAVGFTFWLARDAFGARVVLPLAMGLLCVAALRGVALRSVFSAPWIAVTGGMCYSIYLTHFLLIAALFKVTRHALLHGASLLVNLAIQMVVTGLPVLLLGVVFFVLVERPCMDPNWPSLLWRRLTGRNNAEIKALDARQVWK